MNQSPTTTSIFAAVAKSQATIKVAEFDRTNPHFKNKYATLTSIVGACRAALSANGIAILQGVATEGVKVTVTTLLGHSSGEWISSDLTLTATQDTPQGVGSAITYGRRYGLASMLTIVSDDDDDGEAASTPYHAAPARPPAIPPGTRVWNRLKAKLGDKAGAAWAEAARKALGAKPPSSETWTTEQAAQVEEILFPSSDPAQPDIAY